MEHMIDNTFLLGTRTALNRVVLQPMEGCDAETDGSPSKLTWDKYLSAAQSGAGLIWMEACAVAPEGRTNPRQLMLTEKNLPHYQALVAEMRRVAKEKAGVDPILILQLTHSGRQSIRPMIAYRHPIYEERRPVTDENIVTDAYLETLPPIFAKSALLAVQAGFDGVDVKSCHGYLFQELLSAFTREGKYGGSFENRSRLYLDCVRAVQAVLPSDILLTTRLSVVDMVKKPYGFGMTEEGEMDLSEPDLLIGRLIEAGVTVLNVTLGNPYYNPHVNRPYRRGGYIPPEAPDAGLARFEFVEKHIKELYPDLTVVGSGLSYHREEAFRVAERQLGEGVCDFVGFGRLWLAYPSFYRDYLNGSLEKKKCCLTCSKCTELMRAHQVSGCAVFHDYYRNLYKEKVK